MAVMRRSVASDMTEYAKHVIRSWEARGKTLTSLADRMGVSVGFLSQFKAGRTGMGLEKLEALGEAVGMKFPAFQQSAIEWVDAGCPSSDTVTEERYPNRLRAVRAARELGLSEDAIVIARSMSWKSETDLSPDEWLEEIRSIERRLRRGDVPVPGGGDE